MFDTGVAVREASTRHSSRALSKDVRPARCSDGTVRENLKQLTRRVREQKKGTADELMQKLDDGVEDACAVSFWSRGNTRAFYVACSRCVFFLAAGPSRALPSPCRSNRRGTTRWPAAPAFCGSSGGRAPHHTSAWALVRTEAVRRWLLNSSSQANARLTAPSLKPQIASAYHLNLPVQCMPKKPSPDEALFCFNPSAS
ncbi:uncharacterized protein BDR25DRAFT_112051 [Lindgomyces ingoldianus]|uniref:Uncharacterized protein n=1 Tax=Lindgomyces ingoldianus TaxID=673940 RepID=A0ACB6R8Y7_9PLEO|nr:uncharacterized protein BDR25DRAFT_112051 [Lindgomyces ingoldianus]KAF2474787.1 hypothetical protein BDR25DRAFT_112051 [Lindgomyces ingoldianus]